MLVVNQPSPNPAPNESAERRLGMIAGYQHCFRTFVGLCSVEEAGEIKSALEQAAAELDEPAKS